MHDLVQAGLALGDRHIPLRRGGLHEHQARGCSGLTEGVEEVADRFRSVGVLVAVAYVAYALLDLDASPVGVEFVGDNILDFPALSQDIRKGSASAFDKFGEDYFLIANSMYGSWEKNVDDNAL